jgi:hypothetical protein
MVCLIVKHLFFNSYGPFDRGLEIGVFLLIAYEVYDTHRARREKRKRQAHLNEMFAALSGFMGKGQQLQQSVPHPQVDAKRIPSWEASVRAWSAETTAFLDCHSPRASASFSLIVQAGNADSIVHLKDGNSFAVGGQFGECYRILLVQLDNLRQIMGKAEVYF